MYDVETYVRVSDLANNKKHCLAKVTPFRLIEILLSLNLELQWSDKELPTDHCILKLEITPHQLDID